jgi:hypothetical protein
VVAKWWLEQEADRLAESGAYKAAFDLLRFEVGVVEETRDEYAERLLQELMRAEQRCERLVELLARERRHKQGKASWLSRFRDR